MYSSLSPLGVATVVLLAMAATSQVLLLHKLVLTAQGINRIIKINTNNITWKKNMKLFLQIYTFSSQKLYFQSFTIYIKQ